MQTNRFITSILDLSLPAAEILLVDDKDDAGGGDVMGRDREFKDFMQALAWARVVLKSSIPNVNLQIKTNDLQTSVHIIAVCSETNPDWRSLTGEFPPIHRNSILPAPASGRF
jgi:hypothetical protein